MTYGFLIDPHQAKYRLKGYEVTLPARTSPSVVADSDTSLQLKPEREVIQQEQTTPVRADDGDPSSSQILPHAGPGVSENTGKDSAVDSPNQKDALDEAIQAVRVVHDLVSRTSIFSA